MSPEEVLTELNKMGINTSRSTLLRFEKAGIIPIPKHGAGGRGIGRFTDYPEDTPQYFFASWYLVKTENFSMKELSRILEVGKEAKKTFDKQMNIKTDDGFDFDKFGKMAEEIFKGDVSAFIALSHYLNGSDNYNPEDFYRAKNLIEGFLDNREEREFDKTGKQNNTDKSVKEEVDFFRAFFAVDPLEHEVDEKHKEEIKALNIYLKWERYYEEAKTNLFKTVKKIEILEKTIDFLETENAKLKEEIKTLKQNNITMK